MSVKEIQHLSSAQTAKTILIDTGNGRYPDAGQTVIAPFLAYRGINHIDLLIITHYDSDHYGGLKTLAKSVTIQEIIDNGNTTYHNRIRSWLPQHTPITAIRPNDRITLDPNLTITCLASSSVNRIKDKNNQSIALLIQYKTSNVLLTGDLETLGEHYIVQNYDPIDIDILKLGHHGSKTSTTETFLQWSTPEIGLISAGRDNRYGHPHPSVIDRSQRRNIKLYRTDKHGAIMITTTDEGISMETFRDRYRWINLIE